MLRAQPGHSVRVGMIDGGLGTATVLSHDADTVAVRCALGVTPVRPRVELLLALPRPKVMRRLWAQVAALGVGRILLTNAERVERNYFDTHVLQPNVYRPLLVEDDLDTLCPSGVRLLGEHGFRRVGMGARTLRSDTACVALGRPGGDGAAAVGPAFDMTHDPRDGHALRALTPERCPPHRRVPSVIRAVAGQRA